MARGLHALTEKEKDTLRLLLAGHDAKSMARHFGLSVHTVNERLREARRKLAVGSSKEAARLLREAEGPAPQSVGDKPFGDAGAAPGGEKGGEPGAPLFATPRKAWAIGGLAMLSLALAVLVIAQVPEPARQRPAVAPTPVVAETAATQAARQWLALVDAGDWPGSWAATAPSFRAANTVEAWQSASASARVPLGAALSRRLVAQEMIPAPPSGYQLVRFRTRFANAPDAVETLSLARHGDSWQVAGYMID